MTADRRTEITVCMGNLHREGCPHWPRVTESEDVQVIRHALTSYYDMLDAWPAEKERVARLIDRVAAIEFPRRRDGLDVERLTAALHTLGDEFDAFPSETQWGYGPLAEAIAAEYEKGDT